MMEAILTKRESGWVQMNQHEMVYFQDGICTGKRIPIELYELYKLVDKTTKLLEMLSQAQHAELS